MNQPKKPFVSLGSHLRNVRELAKRSLAEVSGAVEIDEQKLKLIEAGQERPEEEVMLLLISYFNVADQEALHLWKLAEYDTNLNDHLHLDSPASANDSTSTFSSRPMVMLLATDVRTMYSDGLDVSINPAGVTLQFNQAVPNQSQPVTIARVGMSVPQAELVVKTLQKALLHAKYNSVKRLPPPTK